MALQLSIAMLLKKMQGVFSKMYFLLTAYETKKGWIAMLSESLREHITWLRKI